MRRYLSVYSALFTFGVQKFLAYRFDTYVNLFIGNTIWSFFTIFSIYALSARTGGIYGWSREELIILSCIYNIFIGLFSIVFMRNFQELAEVINLGKMDGYLLKPLDSQFFLSVKTVHISSVLRTLVGITVTIVFASIFRINISIINVALFIALIIAGELLLYSLLFMISTVLIWFPRLDNLTELFYTIRGFGRYPQGVYQQLPELIFILIAPFIIVLATPAKALLGKATLYDCLQLIILTVVLLTVSRLFWKFALRSYSSASG